MGGSTNYTEKNVLKELKAHPNFKWPELYEEDTPISYACKCIEMLISPPQEDDESNDIECVVLAECVWLFHEEIETQYLKRVQKLKSKK